MCIGLAALLSSMASHALPPEVALNDLRHVVWGVKDGAPSNVWAMAQTSDGWIWFGGADGLSRFDGVRFERVETQDVGDRSPAVSALRALETGELMIGYHDGGVGMLRKGKFTNYHAAEGLDPVTVFAVDQDATGTLWAATRTGLTHFDGQRWSKVGADWSFPSGTPTDIARDRRGTLWISAARELMSLAHGSLAFKRAAALPSYSELVQSPDGHLWSANDSGMSLIAGQESIPPDSAPTNSWVSHTRLFDREGNLWSLAEDGVNRKPKPARAAFPSLLPFPQRMKGADHLAIDGAKSLLEDRSGNIWLSSLREIHEFRSPILRRVKQVPGLPSLPGLLAGAAPQADGTLWAVVEQTFMHTADADGVWAIGASTRHLQKSDIPAASSIFVDASGITWVASPEYLWRRDGQRLIKDARLPGGALIHPVIAMTDDLATQSLWISILGVGLFLKQGDAWSHNGGIAELPAAEPSAMRTAPDGKVWLGYLDGEILVLDHKKVTRIDCSDGNLGPIRSISLAPQIVVGGRHGIAILKNATLHVVRPDPQSVLENVSGIVQAANGDLWLNSSSGVAHVAAASVDSLTPGVSVPVQVLGGDEGYPGVGTTTQFFGPTAVSSSDGRIWVIGSGGMGWFRPTDLERAFDRAPVLIKSISTAAGQWAAGPALRLRAGTRDLTISYTALNYAHPDQERFRYRLVGFDDAWVDASARREAYYTNLGPGHYRFELLEQGESRHWTTTPVTLDFDIAPTFIQSRLFLGLCVALGAVALLALVRLRVAQLTQREREQMQERMRERERIARELHDTLLQGTQGFILSVQAATSRLRAGDAALAERMLDKALLRGDETMIEGRDRIQDLRSAEMSANELNRALAAAGEELAQAGSAGFSLIVEGDVVELDHMVAEEVYRIAKEGLSNAFRHANARSIEIEIVYGTDQFRLRVRDDGCGLSDEALGAGQRPGHWGLPGMRERAQRIGARFEIWSRPGAGTEIELSVESRSAYVRQPLPAWPCPRWLNLRGGAWLRQALRGER